MGRAYITIDYEDGGGEWAQVRTGLADEEKYFFKYRDFKTYSPVSLTSYSIFYYAWPIKYYRYKN
jgi:hypothetical protein